jgi:hypothetical protein
VYWTPIGRLHFYYCEGRPGMLSHKEDWQAVRFVSALAELEVCSRVAPTCHILVSGPRRTNYTINSAIPEGLFWVRWIWDHVARSVKSTTP